MCECDEPSEYLCETHALDILGVTLLKCKRGGPIIDHLNLSRNFSFRVETSYSFQASCLYLVGFWGRVWSFKFLEEMVERLKICII